MPPELLNPLNPKHRPHIQAFIEALVADGNNQGFLAMTPYRVSYNNKQIEFILTHNLIPFQKQTEDGNNLRFAVLGSILGGGAFGEVKNVHGLLVKEQGVWKYKTVRKYVAKFNVGRRGNYNNSLFPEFEHSRFTPHIKSKYPVSVYRGEAAMLLLRRQQGCGLNVWLDRIQKNPEIYSMAFRLQLCYNLLHMLKTQVYDLGIVHGDIKPENIILNHVLIANLVDYGLAQKLSSPVRHLNGTIQWLDPLLAKFRLQSRPSEKRIQPDRESDLYSAVLIICEVLGVEPRIRIATSGDLISINANNPLTGLLERVVDKAHHEEVVLRDILHKSTRYDKRERLSYGQLLREFKKLLDARLETDRVKIACLNIRSIHTMSSAEFESWLNSPLCLEFINRFAGFPGFAPILESKLGYTIANYPLDTLKAMANAGFNFANFNLDRLMECVDSSEDLDDKYEFFASQGLRFSDNLLESYLKRPVNSYNNHLKLYWLALTRLIYQKTANADAIIAQCSQLDDPFVGTVVLGLIQDPWLSPPVLLNLVLEHLKNLTQRLDLSDNYDEEIATLDDSIARQLYQEISDLQLDSYKQLLFTDPQRQLLEEKIQFFLKLHDYRTMLQQAKSVNYLANDYKVRLIASLENQYLNNFSNFRDLMNQNYDYYFAENENLEAILSALGKALEEENKYFSVAGNPNAERVARLFNWGYESLTNLITLMGYSENHCLFDDAIELNVFTESFYLAQINRICSNFGMPTQAIYLDLLTKIYRYKDELNMIPTLLNHWRVLKNILDLAEAIREVFNQNPTCQGLEMYNTKLNAMAKELNNFKHNGSFPDAQTIKHLERFFCILSAVVKYKGLLVWMMGQNYNIWLIMTLDSVLQNEDTILEQQLPSIHKELETNGHLLEINQIFDKFDNIKSLEIKRQMAIYFKCYLLQKISFSDFKERSQTLYEQSFSAGPGFFRLSHAQVPWREDTSYRIKGN